MYATYHLCPQCSIRRFFVIHKGERVVIMVKKTGEVEVIKPENMNATELDISVIHCIGCSWKGSVARMK